MLGFACLDKCQRLKEFIHCAKAAGENHKAFRVFDKHGFANEEVAEVNRDLHVSVDVLLVWWLHIAADRLPSALNSPPIRSLHDARSAASNNAKACLGQMPGALACGLIHGVVWMCAG